MIGWIQRILWYYVEPKAIFSRFYSSIDICALTIAVEYPTSILDFNIWPLTSRGSTALGYLKGMKVIKINVFFSRFTHSLPHFSLTKCRARLRKAIAIFECGCQSVALGECVQWNSIENESCIGKIRRNRFIEDRRYQHRQFASDSGSVCDNRLDLQVIHRCTPRLLQSIVPHIQCIENAYWIGCDFAAIKIKAELNPQLWFIWNIKLNLVGLIEIRFLVLCVLLSVRSHYRYVYVEDRNTKARQRFWRARCQHEYSVLTATQHFLLVPTQNLLQKFQRAMECVVLDIASLRNPSAQKCQMTSDLTYFTFRFARHSVALLWKQCFVVVSVQQHPVFSIAAAAKEKFHWK